MIGQQIGNYKIISQIGVGGMGEVFLAEHTTIGTRVAVKVLMAGISKDEEQVKRFFGEAKAVNKIRHAGPVKIFDVGYHVDQNGIKHAYLVMEFLEGESLASRIKRLGTLPGEQVADIGRQIAGVLDAVHTAGITHRDLKPDNIFLCPDSELPSGERVKVLDFGIAKLTGTMAGPQTKGTMGTPAYMAPEQWNNAGAVYGRADTYSLGCVMYEMAVGTPPFPATSIGEACNHHLNSKPPRASSIVRTVPIEFDDLLDRMLAKTVDLRPTVREVTRAFDAMRTSGATQRWTSTSINAVGVTMAPITGPGIGSQSGGSQPYMPPPGSQPNLGSQPYMPPGSQPNLGSQPYMPPGSQPNMGSQPYMPPGSHPNMGSQPPGSQPPGSQPNIGYIGHMPGMQNPLATPQHASAPYPVQPGSSPALYPPQPTPQHTTPIPQHHTPQHQAPNFTPQTPGQFTPQHPAKPKSGAKGLLIALGAVAVIGGGGAAAIVITQTGSKDSDSDHSKLRDGLVDLVHDLGSAARDLGSAAKGVAVDAPDNGPGKVVAPSKRELVIANNPFVDRAGVRMLSSQISGHEYELVIGKSPVPFTDPEAPLPSLTEQEAAAFCAAIDARLPTSEEFDKGAKGAWCIAIGATCGPLQEWTSTVQDELAVVRGGYLQMDKTALDKAARTKPPYFMQKDPSGTDRKMASSSTIGFRCVDAKAGDAVKGAALEQPKLDAPKPSLATVTGFDWPDGGKRAWAGAWANEGWKYTFTLNLARAGANLTGAYRWKLEGTPGPMANRIGNSADERVVGSYDPVARRIQVTGQSASDPTLISLDSYDLTIAADSGSFSGKSKTSQGNWSGRISGRPVTSFGSRPARARNDPWTP